MFLGAADSVQPSYVYLANDFNELYFEEGVVILCGLVFG